MREQLVVSFRRSAKSSCARFPPVVRAHRWQVGSHIRTPCVRYIVRHFTPVRVVHTFLGASSRISRLSPASLARYPSLSIAREDALPIYKGESATGSLRTRCPPAIVISFPHCRPCRSHSRNARTRNEILPSRSIHSRGRHTSRRGHGVPHIRRPFEAMHRLPYMLRR